MNLSLNNGLDALSPFGERRGHRAGPSGGLPRRRKVEYDSSLYWFPPELCAVDGWDDYFGRAPSLAAGGEGNGGLSIYTDPISGYPMVATDGTSQLIYGPSARALVNLTAVAFIHDAVVAGDENHVFDSADGGIPKQLVYEGANGNFHAYSGTNYDTGLLYQAGRLYIVAAAFNGAGDDVIVINDGDVILEASGLSIATQPELRQPSGLRLAWSNLGPGTQKHAGKWGEALVIEGPHSLDETSDIVAELASRWFPGVRP